MSPRRTMTASGPVRAGPTSRPRGRFVTLVGPDGVGKTTVARRLIERFDGPTAYVHFRPPLRGPLASAPPAQDLAPPAWRGSDPSPSERVLGWLRLARSVAVFWMGYLLTVRPAVRSGHLVVSDRWGYGYWAQPRPLRFYGPRWLADLAIRLLPRPDLVAVLWADPCEVRRRKKELSTRAIDEEQRRWRGFPLPFAESFDARHPAERVARDIEERLGYEGRSTGSGGAFASEPAGPEPTRDEAAQRSE